MSNGNEVNAVTPFPLAMVICDFVYQDPYTSKFTLIGTFSTISGLSFPLFHPGMYVYAALSGGRGRMPVRFVLTRADDDAELLAVRAEHDFGVDPRAIQEIGVVFAGIVFPQAGEYRVTLHVNDEYLVERRIVVFSPDQQVQHDD
jgi:hypothetical protein